MRLAVLKERCAVEARAAATPKMTRKRVDAGRGASMPHVDFKAAGIHGAPSRMSTQEMIQWL